MKNVFTLMAAAVLLITESSCTAQINNAKTEKVKVYGNCDICEAAIEKAAASKKLSAADWNKESKLASITYDSNKTTLDAVLKNIALAGYDNQSFLAPDAAYNKLGDCCQYHRTLKQPVVSTLPVKDTTTPKQQHDEHQQHVMDTATKETNQLAAVLNHYFSLKDALVATNGNIAAAKAKLLLAAVDAVQMDKLSMSVHHVWMAVIPGLKEDATHISNTKDIARQRKRFMRLSKNMYALIKVAKPEDAVYYQHCPMANDGKGANWLSRERGIKNPYYGSQMLTCGNTVETIKQ